MGLFNDYENSVKVFGENVSKFILMFCKERFGSFIDYPAFYDHLSGYDNLKIVCIIKKLNESKIDGMLNW